MWAKEEVAETNIQSTGKSLGQSCCGWNFSCLLLGSRLFSDCFVVAEKFKWHFNSSVFSLTLRQTYRE